MSDDPINHEAIALLLRSRDAIDSAIKLLTQSHDKLPKEIAELVAKDKRDVMAKIYSDI